MRRTLLMRDIRRGLVLSIVLTALMALASAFMIGPVAAETKLQIVLPGASAPAYRFQEAPRWVLVPGTRVYAIQRGSGPAFDVFRFGSYAYVYRGGTWYRARTWNGRYLPLEQRYLPAQFDVIAREHWRSYPPGWERRAEARGKAKGKESKKGEG